MPEFLVVNPAKRKTKSSPRKRAARGKQFNPAPLGVILSMANTHTRTAAQKAATKRMLAARKNPGIKVVTRYRNKARKLKRNPGHKRNPVSVGGFGIKQIGEIAAGAIVGAAVTRKGTAMILGAANNQGATGYLVNFGLALGAGYAVARWAKLPLVGVGIAAGGVGTIYQRWYDENISLVHKVAALAITGGTSTGKGLGDISYDNWGAASLRGYIADEYRPEDTYSAIARKPLPRHEPDSFVA
ncbi:MAG TPA: hypothetical protein VGE85_11515 [Terracidiphilus sp.]|jgi:hypothetical protein